MILVVGKFISPYFTIYLCLVTVNFTVCGIVYLSVIIVAVVYLLEGIEAHIVEVFGFCCSTYLLVFEARSFFS